MTGAIWVLLMTGGVAALLAAVSRRRFEEWAAPAVFLLTGAIYVFALAGAPELGCRAAQAMGLLSLLAAAVLAVRSREARCRILTPGAAAFALVVLVAGWAHRGQLYTLQDEFSHWGRVVNRLCALGTLPHAVPGALDFPSYPPGAALWEYAWVVLSGGTFSEGATISANNVALAVCFLPLMRYADWRRWKRAVPLLLAAVMLPLVFLAYAYQDVYVDALLGAVAAYALIQWFTLPRGWERSAMTGAAMLALRTGVPIVPIYLPAEKKWFRWNPVVFGEAYYPKAPEGRKPTPEDYHAVADDLMERIEALKPQAGR